MKTKKAIIKGRNTGPNTAPRSGGGNKKSPMTLLYEKNAKENTTDDKIKIMYVFNPINKIFVTLSFL